LNHTHSVNRLVAEVRVLINRFHKRLLAPGK